MINAVKIRIRGIIIIIVGIVYFGILVTEEINEQNLNMVIQHIFRDHISLLFILPLFIVIAYFYEKQRSLQMMIKEKEAEKLEAMKRMGKSLGQDLQIPLETIKNAASVLQNTSKKDFRIIEIINRASENANNMLQGLFDFETEIKLQKNKTNLNIIIMTIVSSMLIPENVKTTIKYGDIPQINADTKKIERVIMNLIINALQAMPEGGKLIITTKKTDTMIEVSTQDTGIGIVEDDINNIFTPFYTTKEKGIGLGLVAVKRIVNAHNGSIHIKSKKSIGTSITIKLPLS